MEHGGIGSMQRDGAGMGGVLVAKPEFRSLGNHSRGFIQPHMLGRLDFMRVGGGIHRQARLGDGAVLKGSSERLLARALDKKMQDDAGERGIEGMAVPLPIAGLAVHLDIAGLFPGFFKLDDRALEVGSGLAVPLAEVENLEGLAIRRLPLRAVFAIEEAGLDFDLPLADDALAQARRLAGGLVAGTVGQCHRSG